MCAVVFVHASCHYSKYIHGYNIMCDFNCSTFCVCVCIYRSGVEDLCTGIIGTPMAHYNKWTLLPLEDQDEEADSS